LLISLNFILLDELKENTDKDVDKPRKNTGYFNIGNGPSTEKLIQITKDHLREDAFWFEVKYKGLLGDASYAEEIRNIWEPARKTPWVVVDWFFSDDHEKRSSQVIFLLNEILVEKIGSKEADKLLRDTAIELIKNNPKVLYNYLGKSLMWYGYDRSKIYDISIGTSTLSYWDVPLNPASCASAVLTNKQFARYVATFAQIEALSFSQSLTSHVMDISRILYSLMIFLWIVFFLLRRVKFDFNVIVLILIHFSVIQFLVLSQVAIHSKYSILPGTISLISSLLILNSIFGSIKNQR
jgi:hypothetical protein